MALLKDLIVYGASRFLADAFGTNIYADKHITNGGTATQFLKGDGTLDSNTYATTSSLSGYVPTSRKVNGQALSADVTLTLDNINDGSSRKLANYVLKAGDTMSGSLTATSFIKSGGTSSQFLKADGSVDSNTYLTSASLTTHAKFADTATAGQVLVSKATNTYEWKTLPTVYDTKVNLASNTGTTTQAFTLNSSADRTMTVKGDGTYLTGAVSGSANSVTITINHVANTTAGTAGQSGASTGVTFNIPYVTYNAGGHITAGGTHEHSITGAQIATILSGQTVGTLTVNNLTVPKTLLIPAHDPSATSSTDTAYLWLGTGLYSETPGGGGGGGDVYDLTLRKNSVSLGTYNLGTSAADINIPINWSDLTPDSTHRFLTDALIDKWDRAYGELIIGTHTTDTNAWTGNSILPTATAMTSGYRFTYWLPRRGSGNATLTLTFQDNTTKTINLYFRGAGRLTTHFAAGSKIDFAYIENALVGATAYTGAWPDSNYEDGNNSAYQLISYYIRTYIYSNSTPLYRYKIYGYRNGRIVPIVVTNQENATQVNKVPASVALDTKQGLWYYNSTTNITSDSTVSPDSASVYMKTVATTGCSYTFNETAPAYCDVYLQGSYDPTTGLFTLDNTQTSGNYRSYYAFAVKSSISTYNSAFTSGKYYWYVGPTYSSANYLQLAVDNPVYYFNGTSLIPAATGASGDFLPLSGGTMTGNITMDGTNIVFDDGGEIDVASGFNMYDYDTSEYLFSVSDNVPSWGPSSAEGSIGIGESARTLTLITPGGIAERSGPRSIYHGSVIRTHSSSPASWKEHKIWDSGNFNPRHYLNNKAGTSHPIYQSLYMDMRAKRNGTGLENRAICAVEGPDGTVYEMIRQQTDGDLVIGHGAQEAQGTTVLMGGYVTIDSVGSITATNSIIAPSFVKTNGTSAQFLKADGSVDSSTYLTGITKAQVEAVLTGNITSHTHSYLPLTGGTITSTTVIPLILNSTHQTGQQSILRLQVSGADKAAIGWQNTSNVGTYLQNLAVSGTPYVNIASDGKFKYKNAYEFYHTNNLTLSTLGGVPTTRTVNNKALSSDITLSLDDVADGSTRKLANYLPLTGGVVTGNVFLKGSANLVTNSTGTYANGIRINRDSTSTWAGMTIGYVSSDQAGGGTGYDSHTWMIATPGTSDYLNISYNGNTSTTIGLTLKGNGVNDLLWNNNKVWHEGNLTKSVLTTLLDSNSGYYLPLTGGSLTNESFGGSLTINRNSTGGDSVICYKANTTVYGYMGIRSNNTPVFYSGTDINTVNTILHSGNYSTWAVPKKDGVRFYPYIGTNSSASFGAQWFKVTLSHNGQAAGANRWYMLSMDLVINSAYSTSNPPTAIKGTVHLQYYFSYNNSAGTYAAGIVKGVFTGMNYPSLQIKYDPANPAIFYVKANGGTNIYNTLSIENMMANDSSANIDYSTTTIEAIAEASIPSSASTVVPIDSYLPLTAGSSYPLTGDLYLNASSAEKSIYMTDASNNAHQVATLTTAGNLTIGNNQPTLGGMTVIRGGTISLAVGDSTTNEKYNVNFFGNNGSFYPTPDNAVTWGNSSKKFKAMYAYNFYGNLDWSYIQNKPTYTLDNVADGSTRKLANYLPLAGGNLTGNLTTDNGKYIAVGGTGQASGTSSNYLSAGKGYGKTSGLYGVKVVSCDQSNCQSGLGQDLANSGLTGWDNNYNMCVVGCHQTSGSSYISFVSHTVNNTTYDYMGGFKYTSTGTAGYRASFYVAGHIGCAGDLTVYQDTYLSSLTVNDSADIGEDLSVGGALSATTGTVTTLTSTTASITNAAVSGKLAIPTVAPTSPDSTKYYLYVNPNGNYSE